MEQKNKERGITLIALIITIIILLILAGISIATLTGENGILVKAQSAKDKTDQEQGRELIQIAINEMLIEKMEEGEQLTLDYIGDNIHERLEISKDEVIKNGEPTETINVIYGNYEYKINDQFQVNTQGNTQGKTTIEVTYEVKGNMAIIRVVAKTEDEKGIKRIILPNDKEESGNNQKEVEIEYIVYNDEEYRFIAEGNDGTKRVKTIKIEGIDTMPPNEAVIEIEGSPTYVGGSTTATIKATVKVSDNKSGIDIGNCRYIINSTNSKIGIDSSNWSEAQTLKSANSTINISSNLAGDKYLHILSVNKSGNKIETVSPRVTFILDNVKPNDAVIEADNYTVSSGTNINITMTVSDSQSGISLENCKWKWSDSSTLFGINSDTWNSAETFTQETIITVGNANGWSGYLHILSVDKVGNQKETVSQKFTWVSPTTLISVGSFAWDCPSRLDTK